MSDEHDEDQEEGATSTEEEEEFGDIFDEAGKKTDESEETADEEEDDKVTDDEAGKKTDEKGKKAEDEAGKKTDDEGKKVEDEAGKKTDESLTETEEDKRGKEILSKEEADQKAIEDAKKAEKDKEGIKDEGPKPYTADDVKSFSGILSKDRLPDTIEIAEGVEVNVKEYMDDFPAAPVVIAMMVQEIIGNLISNGILITGDSLSGVKESITGLDYNNAVYRLAPEIEVKDEKGKVIRTEKMDVDVITDTKEFKDWLSKAPPAHQALFRGTPKDFALGLGLFAKSQNIAAVKDKVKKIDKKAADEKKDHDDLHSTTIRKAGVKSGSDEDEELPEDDFDANFEEAAKKREKEK